MRRLILFLLLLALGAPLVAQVGNCPIVSNDEMAAPVILADGDCRTFWPRFYRFLTIIPNPTDQATATLTFDGVAPADGDEVVLGSKTYAFESGALDADGKVNIGTTPDESLENLVLAVNLTGVAGTDYATGTTAGDATADELSLDEFAEGTLTGTTIADTNTVTIGSRVYTFQDTLTNVAGNVLVGASDSDSLDNLIAAINLSAGAGTLYAAATTIHPTVTAAAGDGDTMDVTAKVAGISGNAIATTDTLTAGDFGAVTLVDGESSIVFTAIIPGTNGNDLDSTTDATDAAFGAATFEDADADPVVTYSLVNTKTATEHAYPQAEVTATSPEATAVNVTWPYYRVSVAGGGARVSAVP